jgi:hypothetical protein
MFFAPACFAKTAAAGGGVNAADGTAAGIGTAAAVGASNAATGTAAGIATAAAVGTAVTAPPLDALTGITAAWSMSRNLLTSFGAGSKYTDVSSFVSVITNQQADTGRNLTDAGNSGRRPALTTAGPLSVTCADFNGSDDFLITTDNAADFFTAASGFMAVGIIMDAYTTNSGTFGSNSAVLTNLDASIGIEARNTGGGTMQCFNKDAGGVDGAVGGTLATGTVAVVHWRHHGGNVYCGLNGVESAATASGNTSPLGSEMQMGYRGGSLLCNFKFFEGFTSNDGSQDFSAAIASMMAQIGAS